MKAMQLLLILCGVLAAVCVKDYGIAQHLNDPPEELRILYEGQSPSNHINMKRTAIHKADRTASTFLANGRFQGSKKQFSPPDFLRRGVRSPQAPDDNSEAQDSSSQKPPPCYQPRHHWRHHKRKEPPQSEMDKSDEAN